jgi:asparagine synthase (glutamine-hydrolysing)
MEGLAGIVYPDVFQVSHLIHPMLDTLGHRGKAEREIYTYKNMQIGVCGNLFASNEKKTLFAGIDGRIDNLQELQEDFRKHGLPPVESDSMALIRGYELWGNNLFSRIDGSFAIILLDQVKERILIVRDRIGKKPLYWYHDRHHFIFASELKAILASRVVPQSASLDALSCYLYFGYIPQDMSPIKDVNKLLPGHYLQFHISGSKVIQPYWSYSSYFEHQLTDHKNTIAKNFDEMLLKITQRDLIEDQPLGCFVSGGLGSASIAYYLRKNIPKEQLTCFTVGFQGQNEEDIQIAGELAKSLNLSHKRKILTPEHFLDDFIKIAWYLDEPLADPGVIATWNLAKLASEQTHLVYSGMGSDELLANHSRYALENASRAYGSQFSQKSFKLLCRMLIPLLNVLYKPGVYSLVRKARSNPRYYDYLNQNALFDEQHLMEASPKLAGLFDPEVFLHKFHHLSRIKSTVSSFLYFDVKTRLVDLFILQYERLTAAHRLEWKAPFLDRQIVEYLAGIFDPDHLAESERTSVLKFLMKNALPKSILNRTKSTQRHLLQNWSESSPLKEIWPLLQKGTLVEAGLISEKWLKEQIQTPEKRMDAFPYLWSILALEVWFRLFIDQAIAPTPPEITVLELLSAK